MRLLILGGTQFVGRHIAEAALARGHRVSIVNRGVTRDELPPDVERIRGDRDAGAACLESLRGRTWDACVDVSGYTARQVRPSAEFLRTMVNRYVFISAVSVYGDPRDAPVTEDCPRIPAASEDVTEVNGDTYGALKVTCENIVEQVYGARSTLLRPQIVAGPHDPYDRFSYWVRRATQPGPMLAPGDGTDHVQCIDARDLARFVLSVIADNRSGRFNLVGPRLTWSEFMTALGAKDIVWVAAKIIQAARVKEDELPLYRPAGGARSSLMHVSNERAIGAGLKLSAPALTMRDTREWLRTSELISALSPEREAELLRLARAEAGVQRDP
ncbi:MAG: NAD-dependent epimerase/dehydratase family protein [Planctomycetota bacterium]